DFARMRFQAGGNRVEPRLKFAQQRDELSRGECDRREVQQEINDLAAVEKFIKVSSARRVEQRFQFRVAATLGQDPQEIGGRLCDLVARQQGLTQRDFPAPRVRYGFFAVATECLQ